MGGGAGLAGRPTSIGYPAPGVGGGLGAGTGCAHTAIRQVADHPYQYAYFSFLPGPAAARLFERDYWGVSSRDGLAWVMAHDHRAIATVSDTFPQAYPVRNNALLLPLADQARLRFVSDAQAQYYIGMYRWHPAPYEVFYGTAVHEIRVAGLPVLTVFRRPGQNLRR